MRNNLRNSDWLKHVLQLAKLLVVQHLQLAATGFELGDHFLVEYSACLIPLAPTIRMLSCQ